MWIKYNPSPVGARVGDCAVRAVAKALNIDWEKAYLLLVINGFSMGDMPSANNVIGSVLRQHGFYRHIVPNECPDCYTIADFCIDHPQGTYVVGAQNHVATIEGGNLYDTWDSSSEIILYYWSKEKEA